MPLLPSTAAIAGADTCARIGAAAAGKTLSLQAAPGEGGPRPRKKRTSPARGKSFLAERAQIPAATASTQRWRGAATASVKGAPVSSLLEITRTPMQGTPKRRQPS